MELLKYLYEEIEQRDKEYDVKMMRSKTKSRLLNEYAVWCHDVHI